MSEKLTEAQLALLNEGYPASDDAGRLTLPRLGMLSKDIMEESGTGKNKKYKVVQAAGTFYTESDEGEVNEETGKKVWTKRFIDDAEGIDVNIVFHRRQLRMYDSSLEKFYSTPIYDSADQVIPLYLDKAVVKKGTPAELQAMFPALSLKGKPTSKLKEEAILYVVYNGTLHQMNLSQSSKWEFKSYSKGLNPSTVVTTLGSQEDTFGSNTYRKVTFKSAGPIKAEDFDAVIEAQSTVRETVKSDERFYLGAGTEDAEAEAQMREIGGKSF
jgi:hypothetical protein